MSEYSAAALQTVNPGEAIAFTESPIPCRRGLVRHRGGTGAFLLSGYVPFGYGCRCNGRSRSANYLVDFGANIAVPDGETVGPISVALAIDGTTLPASIMTATPAAAGQYFNVSRAINAQIFAGCCQTVTVRNTSAVPISVMNANIIFSRADLGAAR